MDQRERTAARRWAFAAGANLAVLLASFDGLSARNTGSIVVAILHWIAPFLDASTVARIHFGIRKLAHVTEYGVLSALYTNAQRLGRDAVFNAQWSAVAVAICATTAVVDEWHQSYVPSRTGSPRDVAIDILGATLAQLVWFAVWQRSDRSSRA